nr:hypothetical protein [Nanoarchaeum sp.]
MIEEAREEIKRADHLIYVSLKYTRTCDIILNIFKRLIAAHEFAIDSSLEFFKNQKKSKVIVPDSKTSKAELLLKLKKEYKPHINAYFLMKKIENSDFGRREEYRKHVTMISRIEPDKNFEIDVPKVMEFFEKTKEFVSLVEEDIL